MPENPAKFSVERTGETTHVRLVGPRITDQVYINELGDELVATLEQAQPPDMLVDLEDVEFLSSSMLGKLIRLLKRTRQAKGRLRLCSIRPSIFEVFEITQLHRVFEIYPDASEALGTHR
jgi:anti-sigma B factor antagonist